MPCFLVGMAAIGKMAIRSTVFSSRFSLFHLDEWTATKFAEFFNFFGRHFPHPPIPYTWCTCDVDGYACGKNYQNWQETQTLIEHTASCGRLQFLVMTVLFPRIFMIWRAEKDNCLVQVTEMNDYMDCLYASRGSLIVYSTWIGM